MKKVTYEIKGRIIEFSYNDLCLYNVKFTNENICTEKDDFSNRIFEQFNDYFNNKRVSFDIPIKLTGTIFQMKVYQYIENINYAEVITYKDVAIAIGKPNAYRAVGNALNKNPLLIIVPCHRVVGSNHKLVGYVNGVDLKQELLELEKSKNTI